jgi:hypothetical protein
MLGHTHVTDHMHVLDHAHRLTRSLSELQLVSHVMLSPSAPTLSDTPSNNPAQQQAYLPLPRLLIATDAFALAGVCLDSCLNVCILCVCVCVCVCVCDYTFAM